MVTVCHSSSIFVPLARLCACDETLKTTKLKFMWIDQIVLLLWFANDLDSLFFGDYDAVLNVILKRIVEKVWLMIFIPTHYFNFNNPNYKDCR